jgi:hypothetical protein
MGNPVGVHTDKEVKNLTPDERALLKQHVLHVLQSSEEIHKIIGTNPKLLKTLTKDPKIKAILRKKARPMFDHLKQK